MKTHRCLLRLLMIIGWAYTVLPCQAAAHESPEHEIEEINEEIAIRGETPDLLLRRAIEYRVLGKAASAQTDLEKALKIAPSFSFAERELSRVYFSLGKTNEALDLVTKAIKTTGIESHELAALNAARAEYLRARSDNKKALEACESAIQLQPVNVDWYMLRSDLHERLKLNKERLKGIEDGLKQTGSFVLEQEWVEALLDDQQFDRALEKIETELQSTRLKSSWLVRRARARLGLGKKEAAVEDLRAAIEEMNTRIFPSSPDVTLLTERAQAHELLGERDLARQDYELARDAGAEEWVKEKIKALKAKEPDVEETSTSDSKSSGSGDAEKDKEKPRKRRDSNKDKDKEKSKSSESGTPKSA